MKYTLEIWNARLCPNSHQNAKRANSIPNRKNALTIYQVMTEFQGKYQILFFAHYETWWKVLKTFKFFFQIFFETVRSRFVAKLGLQSCENIYQNISTNRPRVPLGLMSCSNQKVELEGNLWKCSSGVRISEFNGLGQLTRQHNCRQKCHYHIDSETHKF